MSMPTGRGRLNRERILNAALRTADLHGVESLSMRTLAADLGVKAMSLYNHVANRDEIVGGIVDLVIGEIEIPNPQLGWREAMRARAQSAHEVLVRHPWALSAIISGKTIGPAMLRYVDKTLECLLTGGFSLEQADHVWNVLDSYVYGFTMQELSFPFEPSEYGKAAGKFVHLIPEGEYPSFYRLTTAVISGTYDGVHDLQFGLQVLLDGLEKLLQ